MNLADVLICWSPNVPAIPVEQRGAFALCPDTVHAREIARRFRCVSGAPDPRASDARLEVRSQFVVELAATLVLRDKLSPAVVHGAFLAVDEYQTAFRGLLDARSRRQ